MTDARSSFLVEPGLVYLDAATYGLPPRPALEATRTALERWATGAAAFRTEWETEGERSRTLFAELVGADRDQIALHPTVSTSFGMLAASIPSGSTVLVTDDEYASVRYPLQQAARLRGFTVVDVPFDDLVGAIRPGVTHVATCLVRGQDGRVTDLAAVTRAAQAVGARVWLDATHALPFVPVHLPDVDAVACHGYKHLLCPRGASFLFLSERTRDETVPILGNWRSAAASYGGTHPGGPSAARFDVSLAWHAWVGAAPALQCLLAWQRSGELARPLTLARTLAAGLGLPTPGASLVSVPVADPEAASAALADAGLRAAARGAFLRLSTHLWNTDHDVRAAIDVIGRLRA